MKTISVAVFGALGKVGKEVLAAVSREEGLSLAAGVDQKAQNDHILLDNSHRVPLYKDLGDCLRDHKPQVMVDFSIADASMQAVRLCTAAGVHMVIGTTGFSDSDYAEMERLAKEHNTGIIIAPNFALGAVVLMHLCRLAAKYFDNAEIIEMHHDQKADAPSGTALATSKGMLEARKGRPFKHGQTKKENLSGCRGGETGGIGIHSVRLPGFVASQEVIFGLQGQTLKLRHDAINRECYMPGVILAVKEVSRHRGKAGNLEGLLELGG